MSTQKATAMPRLFLGTERTGKYAQDECVFSKARVAVEPQAGFGRCRECSLPPFCPLHRGHKCQSQAIKPRQPSRFRHGCPAAWPCTRVMAPQENYRFRAPWKLNSCFSGWSGSNSDL